MGVNMGEDHLQPKDKLNKRGYYEDRRWQKIHKGLVGKHYGHKEPNKLPPKFVTATYELALECNKNPIWGFKSPRACFTHHLTTPIIRGVTKDIKVVVVDRELKQVAQSLHRHSKKAYKHITLDWEQAVKLMKSWNAAKNLRIDWFEREGIPIHRIKFSELLREPWLQLVRLADFIFTGYEEYFCGINTAALWVDPKMIHFGRDNGTTD